MAAECTHSSSSRNLTPNFPSSLTTFLRCCTPKNLNNNNHYSKVCPHDEIWSEIRREAESDMKQDPFLSNLYRTAILSHPSLESALSNHLSLKLCSAHVSSDALAAAFTRALSEDGGAIGRAVRDDLRAVRDRDPACVSYAHCFLYYKGFLACGAYRLAHYFWINGRTALAVLIQSRVSEVFAVDIHPAAVIGSGVVIDHATGVVVGETAVVGDNVTILHNVTLGGTGKTGGDRHPKIGDGVLIGAGAKVLGNIIIGRNARIGAGALVLKEVPAGATAVGNPARLVESKRV